MSKVRCHLGRGKVILLRFKNEKLVYDIYKLYIILMGSK